MSPAVALGLAGQHSGDVGDIPKYFCWSKIGAEAGETVADILTRKEVARVADGGSFLWGIGQSVGGGVRILVDRTDAPEVLFTDMLSKPKEQDSSPTGTVLWTRAVGLDGRAFDMPPHSLVTSRDAGKKKHWALVVGSDSPIDTQQVGLSFSGGDVVNIERRTPLGGSQVTAAVEYTPGAHSASSRYHVRFRVELVPPYVVELGQPVEVPPAARDRLRRGDLSVFNDLRSLGG